ncbi:Cof-type HAD-IIB family hydrolase [Novosphingobium album (ex Liu et al. 2023)]|uniref:Cof-type HAD-IIB family hydrolase n=1 Tax=Novosphingobium album (ex Liu et al. 2023) TaxID=3031130 RepID=A0ABT5WRW6_9SPHN|nr:Cof-type HAD-IIB family hydrolase [Novosphingobium album (ex Liu et al. 2023)]MDE8652792.1 Cof-type HAD-IIB family hydrolase [Novosphingobium album (ex Liu et al. 2023)]
MSTAIRLLVSDIDGTLVRGDKTLSDVNRAAIQALEADGVAVTLISSRPPGGMRWLAETLGIAGPMAAFNGGTVFDADGTIRFAYRLVADDAAAALSLTGRYGVTPWVFADGAWFTPDPGNWHSERERRASCLDPVLRTDFAELDARVDKIVGVSDDSDALARFETEVGNLIGPRAAIARSHPYCVDITHRLANKGDGITALATAGGLDLAQVAALGDMTNDLPMFARAGFSVAMGQAPADVQAAANAVAAANEQDGVADAIERFIRPRININDPGGRCP